MVGRGTPLARHLIPMIPFLGLGFAWYPVSGKKWLAALGAISVILIVSQSVVEPHFEPREPNADLYNPWQTVQRTGHPLAPPYFVHSLPDLIAGRISINPFNHAIFATGGKLWTLAPLAVAESILLLWLRRGVKRKGLSGN